MTEEDWLNATDPTPLLVSLEGQQRKLRLFACACCRRRFSFLGRQGFRDAIETSESFADGLASEVELTTAHDFVYERTHSMDRRRNRNPTELAVLWAIMGDLTRGYLPRDADYASTNAARGRTFDPPDRAVSRGGLREKRHQSHLLRDIFGNPFRPVTFSPEWRTEAAVGIAAKMYDARDFGNMPVLADALQDAGCEHADILAHCREPGTHVRGCWVVDLVLGKS